MRKQLYLGFGWLSFAVGFIGIFLPLLPTVIFWILAVWAWSHGAPHLAKKVFEHPEYGHPVREFFHHGIIARKGKYAAIISMCVSYALFLLLISPGRVSALVVAGILILVATWIAARPEAPANKISK